MDAAQQPGFVTEADYLSSELLATVKHEYLGGTVYAMAGARNVHNQIASNTLIAFGTRLRGHKCIAFNSDTKIRVRLPSHTRYYYPDASVVCRPNPPADSFHDDPVVVVEVLSASTRRTDLMEKKDAYLAIPSLSVYLLLEQDTASAVLYRRTPHGFVPEAYQADGTIPLPELGFDIPLSELYEKVEFSPECNNIPPEIGQK